MAKIRIGVDGAAGRMGQAICQISENQFASQVEIGALFSRQAIGHPKNHSKTSSALNVIDVLIDFSSPQNTMNNLVLCQENSLPLVIGTTGLNAAQEEKIRQAAKEVPVLYSANMSVGVNLMMVLIEKAALGMGDKIDIEIIEAHHRYKKDAPSGTALALGKAVAAAYEWNFDEHAVLSREGNNCVRQDQEIGFAAIRAGEIIGDHTVMFVGENEQIEIRHRALKREVFAEGAVKAAIFLSSQKPGLYSMRDCLGL